MIIVKDCEIDRTIIHERIAEAIQNSGLTAQEIVEQTGISLRRIEHLCQDRLPKGRELISLSRVLKVSSDYLLAIQ